MFAGTPRAVIRADKVLLLESLDRPPKDEKSDNEEDQKAFSDTAQSLRREMRAIMVKDRLRLGEDAPHSEYTPFEFM